ncbi:MAG: surface-adhesin E family protein [Nostoc sp.]|uniref:surface-adhesin E family protein n=1 Tax=Nostoc sp. TaxID=1180 RepID=UPI002FF78B26
MKRILGLAIVSLIAFPSTALAADWVLVNESSDGTRIFIDNESYEKRGTIAWYWQLVKQESGVDEVTFKTSYFSMDCRNRKVRLREGFQHDSTGKLIFSHSYGDTGPLMQIIPDTTGEKIFRAVCFR